LERCVEAFADDAKTASAVDDLFLNAKVYIRVDAKTVGNARSRTSNNDVYRINYYTIRGADGVSFIPVYSSKEKMLKGLGDGPFLGLWGREVLGISKYNAIFLNYNVPPSVIWDGQSKEDLKARVGKSPDFAC
jgi:hypothetical protein